MNLFFLLHIVDSKQSNCVNVCIHCMLRASTAVGQYSGCNAWLPACNTTESKLCTFLLQRCKYLFLQSTV